MHIKAVWGVLSLVALTLGTTRLPSAATLECARTSLSSVSTCAAADRLRPTTRGQNPPTKRTKPVSKQALPNLSDAARVGSEATSCDVSRQISKRAGDSALSKNCFPDPATTRDTLAERAPSTPLAPTSPKPQRAGIGTAFAINGSGEFLTNHHVVKSCTSAPRLRIAGEWQEGRAIVSDERNDLAVVRVQPANAVPPLRFRDGNSIRPADPVVVVGFPYAGLLTQSPQVTTGVISALAGIHDDSRYVQLTAPVQPGSSGGPLLDSSGNVIGIVSSKLDTMAAAEWTGTSGWILTLPENINFATKNINAREFLDANHIAYDTAPSTTKLDAADVGELAARSVVLVGCGGPDQAAVSVGVSDK
jgi:S1-C subfamily serine protease